MGGEDLREDWIAVENVRIWAKAKILLPFLKLHQFQLQPISPQIMMDGLLYVSLVQSFPSNDGKTTSACVHEKAPQSQGSFMKTNQVNQLIR